MILLEIIYVQSLIILSLCLCVPLLFLLHLVHFIVIFPEEKFFANSVPGNGSPTLKCVSNPAAVNMVKIDYMGNFRSAAWDIILAPI